jgi:hypothetical protein
MAATMFGFPYWQIQFDENGKPDSQQRAALLREIPQQKLRHLLVFSHGWNNNESMAEDLYSRFFEQVARVLKQRSVVQGGIGVAGVIWPSMRWADEVVSVTGRRRAAAGTAKARPQKSDADLIRDLKAVFAKKKQRDALDAMARLLEERPHDPRAYARFQRLMATLAPASLPPEDNGEHALLTEEPDVVFGALASEASSRRRAAAGLGAADRIWDGAKEAARALTYWTMKERAGVVGEKGLGPMIGALHDAAPELRIHLLGHSFGARLVSFALAGLPDSAKGTQSPVKSLVLLQGAFSHFAFADALPHDRKRGGALKGMANRVDGPVLVTHSRKDTAVSDFYPKASFLQRQDAAAAGPKVSRWGAMGGLGAQAVNATDLTFANVGAPYRFQPGRFFNLDGNNLIVNGGPPSGAHSDIFYDRIAWAVVAGAGIA